MEAFNYANDLFYLNRFEEAKSLLRRQIPVAQRVLGENHESTIKTRWVYAEALYKADGATLEELRESVETLEDMARIARRVLGGSHPHTENVEHRLREARAALAARVLQDLEISIIP